MIIDLGVLVILGIFTVKGFRNGFVPSLLGLLGYLLGGFAGLLVAREISSSWSGFWSLVGVHLLSIFFGAKVGQTILKSIGKGIRGLVGPLKFLDSLIGAAVGIGKGIIIAFLVIQLLPLFSFESIEKDFEKSEVVQYFETHTPELINQGFEKLKEISR